MVSRPGYSTPAPRGREEPMQQWGRGVLWAGLLLVGAVWAQEWRIVDRPPVRIFYQPGNGSEAQVLAQGAPGVLAEVERDLGLEAGGGLTVRILPPREAAGAGSADGAPHWAVGYVRDGSREVVLRGESVRSYPFGDLLSVFAHELTHVLLGTVPRAESLPRWFHEGVAVMESDRKSTRLNSSHSQNLVCRLLLEKKKKSSII